MREPMLKRRQSIWQRHPFGSGRGLEIGPLYRAIVRREEADVRYVDVWDRAGLVAHYAADPNVDTDLIPEIDFPLLQPDGRTLSLAEAIPRDTRYDWVVASHVVGHVPDLIGWLADIAEVTVDDAALVLLVPDRRFTFDVHRPPTTTGQVLQAHLDRDRQPSVRAVHDHYSAAVNSDTALQWSGDVPSYSARRNPDEKCRVAESKVAEVLAGTYVDAHVWIFTPQSFIEQIRELRLTGHSSWRLTQLVPTAVNANEFLTVLRRAPRSADSTGAMSDEVLSAADRPDWLLPVEVDDLVPGLQAKVAELQQQVIRNREKMQEVQQRQRRRRAGDQRRIASLEHQLATRRGSRLRKLISGAVKNIFK